MARAVFTAGTRIWIEGRTARILACDEPHRARVAFDDGNDAVLDLLDLYERGLVRWEDPAHAPPTYALEQVSEAAWSEALRREKVLQRYAPESGMTLAQLAESESVSVKTLTRWGEAYRRIGLIGLVPRTAARGAPGRARLDEHRESLLAEVLEGFYLTRHRPTIEATYQQVTAEFTRQHLPVPGLNTVRTRIHALNGSRVTTAREGGARSRSRFMVSRGPFPGADAPLETVLVDHTPLDVHLVDEADRSRVLGRPYLTLALDACTRMIYGYFLSFDPPSYVSVAMTLLQGALPKDDLLRRFGLKKEWPVYGLPAAIHVDNGKEFRSKHLVRFAEQYTIVLEHRPVRLPHWGGRIERAIGTINGFTHGLAGTAKSSVKERGDYDPAKHATMTLAEIEEYLVRRIVEHYHAQPHLGAGASPLQLWREKTANGGFAPRMAPDPRRLLLDLLPFEERTIQKDGIALFDLDYSSDEVRKLKSKEPARRQSQTYVVKYDPRDLSRIWLVVPAEPEPLEVPLTGRSADRFSLLELRRARAIAKAHNVAPSQAELTDMILREREQLARAEEATKRERRLATRMSHQRLAVAAAPAAPLALEAPRHEEVPTVSGDVLDLSDGLDWIPSALPKANR